MILDANFRTFYMCNFQQLKHKLIYFENSAWEQPFIGRYKLFSYGH